ncbi:MAG: hypothetical protein M0R32_09910 [Candidatus Cloacimonetes bacterium]|jgi:hypothetical protein|nr:hypothetical protein [Candidatus Cloacimonadota bacterium]
MIEKVVGSKKYTLSKVDYQAVGGIESLYLEVSVVEDLDFGVREYTYGMSWNQDEIDFFMLQVGGMEDYVVNKLIESDA